MKKTKQSNYENELRLSKNLCVAGCLLAAADQPEKRRRETAMELISISKRVHGAPKFLFYALADGIFTVFARCKKGIWLMLRKKPKDPQLSFFTDAGFAWG
jgi:hypothetical protein